MLLDTSVGQVRDDFFEQRYDQLLAQFRWLLTTLAQAPPDDAARERLECVSIQFSVSGREVHFCLMHGVVPVARPATIRLPYALFRRLLFIDFGQFLTCAEFLAWLEVETDRFIATDGIDVALLNEVAKAWFTTSYRAAEAFFASEQNLRSYFYNSQSVFHWWNEDKLRQAHHRNYTITLCEMIDPEHKTLLDIGCGLGRFGQIYERASTAILTDISLPMIWRARERNTSTRTFFCQADTNHMPFAGGVDIVMAMQMMMHITDPFSLLQSFAPLLKGGGAIWTDFTCSARLKRDFWQESFFTRLYLKEYVQHQCRSYGFTLEHMIEIPDRHDNYWLVVKLTKR